MQLTHAYWTSREQRGEGRQNTATSCTITCLYRHTTDTTDTLTGPLFHVVPRRAYQVQPHECETRAI